MSRVPAAVSFRLLAVTFLVVACCTSSTQALPPLYFQQSILNNSGVPCDDLELMFSSAITNMRVTGDPYGGSVMANSATSYTVTGLSISDSTEVNLRWKSSGTPNATISGGTWTVAGFPVMTISQANMNLMDIRRRSRTGNIAPRPHSPTTRTSPSPTRTSRATSITTSPIIISTTSTPQPARAEVLSLASSFVLAPAGDPGDSITYDLGTVNPNDYELVLATAAASSNPANSFPERIGGDGSRTGQWLVGARHRPDAADPPSCPAARPEREGRPASHAGFPLVAFSRRRPRMFKSRAVSPSQQPRSSASPAACFDDNAHTREPHRPDGGWQAQLRWKSTAMARRSCYRPWWRTGASSASECCSPNTAARLQ